jgi:RHS repeat-associated protein
MRNLLNNYKYDELGNLIDDKREEIANIEWTVSGKVKHITRTAGSTKPELWFAYGADGQRISKTVGDPLNGGYREYYLRDAQGNVMAMYKYANNGTSLKVTERPVYGSKRLGSYTRQMELMGEAAIPQWPYVQPMQAPLKRYELTDHLGNVAAVVTGRLLPGNGSGGSKQAELVSAQGYEPFGALLPGRNYSSDAYRFAFNGKEKDDEVYGAIGTSYDYGFRTYDPRVARFLSVDPLAPQYPMLTPYQFASNMPIWAVDLDGAEAWVYTETDGVGHAFIVVPSSDDVKELVVYSYGRYNGSSTPSLGGFGPVGDGVLIKKEGQSAKEYIRERLSLDNGKSTFVFEFPKADAEKIRNYFDAQFNNGTPLPTGSKAEQKYGDEAKVVDQYIIAPMFGQKASNCVTKTCAGIERGGSLDEFTPVGDGGAYIDLRNQIDPKVMGGLLWMMGRQDAADNPNNRNVIDVTDQQKNDYGIAPK